MDHETIRKRQTLRGQGVEPYICIDANNSDLLKEGQQYFIYEAGAGVAYVSRFPRPGSYFGMYQLSRFKQHQEPTEPPAWDSSHLDRSKIYSADLFYSRRYRIELGRYYIKPRNTHANFYKDPACMNHLGCFPLAWFTNLIEQEETQTETPENDHSNEITPREYQSKAQDIKRKIGLFERPDGQLSFF